MEPAAVDPRQYAVGLDQRVGDVEVGVDRAVHGDEVLVADDLVQLEQVDVTGGPRYGDWVVTNTWSSYPCTVGT